MENHLNNDNICNIVNLYCPILFYLQGITNNVKFTFYVGDNTRTVYN